MRQTNKIILLISALILSSCMRVYEVAPEDEPLLFDKSDHQTVSALPYQRGKSGFLEQRLWANSETSELYTIMYEPDVNAAGVKLCPANRKCSDEAMLPYQPCAQPMPTYYGDISATQTAEGIVLLHPVTRAQIVCFDYPGQSAVQCAESFKAAGYVLVTDIPSLPAKYDFLKDGSYPGRRYRNGGEHIPRW